MILDKIARTCLAKKPRNLSSLVRPTHGVTQVTTLPNGMRVASENLGGETVSVGVWIDAGSRFEDEKTNGVAHFLEHISFKGTARRSQTDIELEVENIGGHFNAYTSREQTAYFAKVFRNDMPRAVDLLADVLQHSRLDEKAIEREREVILREQEEVEKQTEEVIFDHLHAVAYPDSSLGMTILGPERNIRSITKDNLQAYIRSNYLAPRMVLSAAGAVDHDKLVELADKAFSALPIGPSVKVIDAAKFTGAEVRHRDDTTPLAHMVIAVQGASWTSPDYFPLLIAQAVVGSWNRGLAGSGLNLAGKLAQVVSQNDLAQSFMSFNTAYSDTGLFGIYLVSDRVRILDDLIYEVQQEWVRICLNLTDAEVARAKMQLKSAILMSLDGTTQVCEDIGRQILAYGRRFDWKEVHQMIDAVDTKTVRQVASDYLYDRCPAVVGLGNIGSMPDYSRIRAATLWLRN